MTPEEIYSKRKIDLQFFTEQLQQQIPFQLVKFNDGEWHAICGRTGSNCDNHIYSSPLQKALYNSYLYLNANNVWISDYVTNFTPFPTHTHLANRLGYPKKPFVFFSLLHDLPYKGKYPSLIPELYDFYRTLREDQRPKTLVGPTRLDATDFLQTDSKVTVPLIDAFNSLAKIKEDLTPYLIPNSIVLLCCGFVSCLLTEYIHRCDPSITVIDLGSAIDPVLVGKTRKSQMPKEVLQEFYKDMLPLKTPPLVHTYEEIQGWFNFADYYTEIVKRFPSGHFVELGVWKGKSSVFLATEIANSGKPIILDCVDHFQGSPSELKTTHAEARTKNIKGICSNNLRLFWSTKKNNDPTTRIDNIVKLVVAPSPTAAKQYRKGQLDFVFIDAGHTTKEVVQDIRLWLPLVRSGGILAGHDYNHDSVRKAVDMLLPSAKPKSKSCWEYELPS